jgi:hypothetical protein
MQGEKGTSDADGPRPGKSKKRAAADATLPGAELCALGLP